MSKDSEDLRRIIAAAIPRLMADAGVESFKEVARRAGITAPFVSSAMRAGGVWTLHGAGLESIQAVVLGLGSTWDEALHVGREVLKKRAEDEARSRRVRARLASFDEVVRSKS